MTHHFTYPTVTWQLTILQSPLLSQLKDQPGLGKSQGM